MLALQGAGAAGASGSGGVAGLSERELAVLRLLQSAAKTPEEMLTSAVELMVVGLITRSTVVGLGLALGLPADGELLRALPPDGTVATPEGGQQLSAITTRLIGSSAAPGFGAPSPRANLTAGLGSLSGPSRLVSEFVLMGRIGRGGMGSVFRAKHHLDGQMYAIKAVPFAARPGMPDRSALAAQRVMREVHALAQLNHPHVCRYYQAWVETDWGGPDTWGSDSWRGDGWIPASPLRRPARPPVPLLPAPSDGAKIKTSLSQPHLGATIGSALAGAGLGGHERRGSDGSLGRTLQLARGVPGAGGLGAEWLSGGGLCEGWSTTEGDDESACDSMCTDSSSSFAQSPRGLTRGVPSVPRWDRSDAADEEDEDEDEDEYEEESSSSSLSVGAHVGERGMSLGRSWTYRKVLLIQMELCERVSLRDYLQRRDAAESASVRASESLELLSQIASGLEHVHSRGLVHRDLKPSNCCFAGPLHIKLLDFGLARPPDRQPADRDGDGDDDGAGTARAEHADPVRRSGRAAAERAGVCGDGGGGSIGVGTASYAAPEQLRHGVAAAACDMFPLGIIGFELFHVFGSAMERAKIFERLRAQQLPAEFEARQPLLAPLLRRLLSARPAERPLTDAVRHTLDAVRREWGRVPPPPSPANSSPALTPLNTPTLGPTSAPASVTPLGTPTLGPMAAPGGPIGGPMRALPASTADTSRTPGAELADRLAMDLRILAEEMRVVEARAAGDRS